MLWANETPLLKDSCSVTLNPRPSKNKTTQKHQLIKHPDYLRKILTCEPKTFDSPSSWKLPGRRGAGGHHYFTLLPNLLTQRASGQATTIPLPCWNQIIVWVILEHFLTLPGGPGDLEPAAFSCSLAKICKCQPLQNHPALPPLPARAGKQLQRSPTPGL